MNNELSVEKEFTTKEYCEPRGVNRAYLVSLKLYSTFVNWEIRVPQWGNKVTEVETHNDDPLVFFFQEQRQWNEKVSDQCMIDLFNRDYRFYYIVVDKAPNKFIYQRILQEGEWLDDRLNNLPVDLIEELRSAIGGVSDARQAS